MYIVEKGTNKKKKKKECYENMFNESSNHIRSVCVLSKSFHIFVSFYCALDGAREIDTILLKCQNENHFHIVVALTLIVYMVEMTVLLLRCDFQLYTKL